MAELTLVFVIADVALGLIFLVLCMVILRGGEEVETPGLLAFVSFCVSVAMIGSAVLLVVTPLQLDK